MSDFVSTPSLYNKTENSLESSKQNQKDSVWKDIKEDETQDKFSIFI
jgi:hypothetical protein